MGKYINVDSKGTPLPSSGKVAALLNDGATRTSAEFQPNLVCVVNNGMFEAAAYCYNESEFKEFANTSRPTTWLIVPNAESLAK